MRAILLFVGFCSTASLGSAQGPKTDFVGDPLPRGAIARFGSNRLRHAWDVSRIVHTASGKIVSIGGGIVAVWDGKTGKELLRIDSDERICRSLAVSHDERFLASGVETGKRIHQIDVPRVAGAHAVTCIAFAPDGRSIASAGNDWSATLWELPPELLPRKGQ